MQGVVRAIGLPADAQATINSTARHNISSAHHVLPHNQGAWNLYVYRPSRAPFSLPASSVSLCLLFRRFYFSSFSSFSASLPL